MKNIKTFDQLHESLNSTEADIIATEAIDIETDVAEITDAKSSISNLRAEINRKTQELSKILKTNEKNPVKSKKILEKINHLLAELELLD
jgi:seryl-tRNA synthetase